MTISSLRTGALRLAAFVSLTLCSIPLFAQPYNGTLNFNGTSGSKFTVAHDPALNPTNALTIELWVNLTSTSGCRSLVGKGYGTTYWVGVCEGALRSYTRGSGSAHDGGAIPLNTWTHLAVTTDGTTRYHYVNGELAGTFAESSPGTPLPTNTNPFMIGNDPNYDVPPLGRIDEVRLWNIARTQADIRRTMRGPINDAASGLVAVWHLDGDGTDLISARNGSISGAAAFSPAPAGGFCQASATQLCLLGGRFAVTVAWRTPDNATGVGRVVPGYSDQSGLFWFFNADNWELMVKALNGCALNSRHWIFSAATTNVEYDVTVRNLVTLQTKTYHNAQGVAASAVTDTDAFDDCTVATSIGGHEYE